MYIDIKRIMTSVKVEDGHIILEKPLEVMKYRKKVIIRQINWMKQWDKFALYLGVFLQYYMNVCQNSTLPDNLNELNELQKNVRLTIRNRVVGKRAFKYLKKICRFTNLRYGWMKRKFSIDDWIEIFLYVYLYNILGVKKNLKNALKIISKVLSS